MNKTLRLLVVIALVAACTGDVARNPGSVVRDSAGIRIVESRAPLWPANEEWRLGPRPMLDIGGTTGQANYELFRALSAVRLSNGHIAVTNAYHEIRYYDSDGSHVRTVGGEGSGPGEFQRLQRIYMLPGDTILANDERLARYSVFTGRGNHVRTVNLRMEAHLGGPILTGVFDDRSLLVSTWQRPNPSELDVGPQRVSVPLYRLDTSGEQVSHLGAFPGDETYVRQSERGISFEAPLFRRVSAIVAWGDRWYAADTDRFEISVFDEGGSVTSIVRRQVTSTPVRSEHVDAVLQQLLSGLPDENTRRVVEQQYRSIPLAETLPAIGLPVFGPPLRTAHPPLHVDDVGNIWVMAYNVRGVNAPTTWSVFEPGGTMLGDVVMPAGFWPTHIGEEFILGVWQDQLDVEHVRLYDLIKPAQ